MDGQSGAVGANANLKLIRARRRLLSPSRPGECMSRSELAAAVNAILHRKKFLRLDVDPMHIAKLEAGVYHWIRDDQRRAALREALQVERDEDIGLYRTRRSRFDASARRGFCDDAEPGTAAKQSSAGALLAPASSQTGPMALLDTLSDAALEHGWAAVRPVVARQLTKLDGERRGSTLSVELAVADARWSEFMSWVCDNGGFPEGQMWLSRAYASSMEAKSPALTAYILMRQSQQALDGGDATSALALSRKALRIGGLPPRTQALCLTRLAESLALTGDEESLTLIGAAGHRAQADEDQPADLISRHCDDRYIDAMRARCCYLLGDGQEATAILREVLRDERPSAPLDRGIWLSYLAAGYAHSDPERAADAGIAALTVTRTAQSARLARALLPTAIQLRRHRQQDTVARFLAEHRRALTSLVSG